MDNIAIRVENVSKNFLLPHDKVSSVKSIFTNMFSYITKQRTYETQHALHDVSLEIKKGEFFGIVGRNGSGKSTLLKMIAGIYQPTKGKIQVNGKLVPFIELGVGFNPELTGRQNVYLNGALLGFSEEETDAQYDEIVAFAELEDFMDQKLKNYSSGMQVRLAFSAAIRAKADILLVDEVLAVGDEDFQRKCFDYFKSLKKEGTTVVFVTHNMSAVRQFCDRAVLIENSNLVVGGTANKVASEYSKMFIDGAQSTNNKKNESNRWGDRAFYYEKIEIPNRLTEHDEQLIIKAYVKANQNTSDPIFGFHIKNAAGENIMGTNSLIERKKISHIAGGETIDIEWSVPNIFNDGSHKVSLAAVYKGGTSVADWWEDAATVAIYKSKITPYVVAPKVGLKVIPSQGNTETN